MVQQPDEEGRSQHLAVEGAAPAGDALVAGGR